MGKETENEDKKRPLTKKVFERLLTRAAQPIRKPPAPEAEQTSGPSRSDG